MENEQKKKLMADSGFKCTKCGYYSPMGNNLEINLNFNAVLCSICNIFAPDSPEKFNQYVGEKIEWPLLETFRNSGMNRASHSPHKQGMIAKSKQGLLMARPAFGYYVKKGQLIVNPETSEIVRGIFSSFLQGRSLNQISKTFGISLNGIKKILKNFTYLGKIKFDNQIMQGNHAAIISPDIFNQAQTRFEEVYKKRKLNEESLENLETKNCPANPNCFNS